MKIFQKKVKIITAIILGILLISLIIMCFYTNKEMIISRIANNGRIAQEQEKVTSQTIDTSKWDLEKVNIVYDTNNVPVPVPKGYVASGVDGEHTVNTGFVIYEGETPVTGLPNEVIGIYSTDSNSTWVASCTRNQWVWVPVPDSSRIYSRDSNTGKAKSKLYEYSETGRTLYYKSYSPIMYEPEVIEKGEKEKMSQYNMQGVTKEKLLQELEAEYEATVDSIERYGGFYIGRYETGNVSEQNKIPVIQRMNTKINNITWYNAYNNIKNIQKNGNIKSNMIWGCLWDETLQWLVDSGSKTYEEIKDSSEWGNHANTIFEYISENGEKKIKDTSIIIPTGSTERNKANNIYDMAGNIRELTLENYMSFGRTDRGGGANYNSSDSVDYRLSENSASESDRVRS